MFVNKYKIRLGKESKFLNFPITLSHSTVGQSDMIEDKFIKVETDKAINGIVDHEKVRLTPIQKNEKINRVDYSLNLLKGGSFPSLTSYGSEGFVNDDIKFKRNNFKKSFLNLSFYDSDVPTNQNYLGNVTLFSKLSRFDINGVTVVDDGVSDSSEVLVETPKNFGTLKATYDAGIKSNLFLGHTCTNFPGFFPQITRYYLDGLSWKREIETTFGTPILDCAIDGQIGVQVSNIDGIDSESFILFGSYRLVSTNYEYNGKVYSVYTKWSYDLLTKISVVTDVFLVCTYDPNYITNNNTGSINVSINKTIEGGEAKDVSLIPLKFIVEDPIVRPRGFAEGFYIYHEKVEVPTSIYMRSSFNNAKSGLSTDLITTREPQDIDDVLSKLHIKYDLKIDGDIYYYELDTTYSDNIKVSGDIMVVELFEIQVL